MSQAPVKLLTINEANDQLMTLCSQFTERREETEFSLVDLVTLRPELARYINPFFEVSDQMRTVQDELEKLDNNPRYSTTAKSKKAEQEILENLSITLSDELQEWLLDANLADRLKAIQSVLVDEAHVVLFTRTPELDLLERKAIEAGTDLLNEGSEAKDYFEFGGMAIHDPYTDESTISTVDPVEYYGAAYVRWYGSTAKVINFHRTPELDKLEQDRIGASCDAIDTDRVPSDTFMFCGMAIHDPYTDKNSLEAVDPLEYYGLDYVVWYNNPTVKG
jgi:hypothetical protein